MRRTSFSNFSRSALPAARYTAASAALLALLILPLLAGCAPSDERKNSDVAPPTTRPAVVPQAPPAAQAAAQQDMERVKADAERQARESAARNAKQPPK